MKKDVMLSEIHGHGDVAGLNCGELKCLCEEIRSIITENVIKNGGHLASNLGVVELTVALHSLFDFEKDHLIFDVGHQCYAHKLLTGRRNFDELRVRGGLSGFTKRAESRSDCFGAGHSSTSLSAAIGFAEADRISGSDSYTVAFIGDGAFTGGMVHEALNNCGEDLRLIIILNENEMSISRNVGKFAGLFSKIRSARGYYKTKRKTVSFVKKLPLIGSGLFNLLKSFKQKLKNKVYGSNYFENLGLYYLGPVDGNDIEKVINLLSEAKSYGKPCIIHAKTKKGKGFPPAEGNPGKYHCIAPEGKHSEKNFSAMAGEILTGLGHADERICAVTAAMADGTGLQRFADEIPERFFDVGIAEEHALTFSAGLAANGMRPFFAVYSSFLQRGFDNLIHDIALQNLPVTVLIDRAGLNTADGPTHHGIFDVAFLSEIPNFTVFAPYDFLSLRRSIEKALVLDCPCAVRYSNIPDCGYLEDKFIYDFGTFRTDFEDCGRVIITYGRIVTEAIKAQADLENCGIVLLEQLKPYEETAEKLNGILRGKKAVFLEEGIKNGGAGMIFASLLETEMTVLAVDGIFETERITSDVYSDFGIGRDDIVRTLK